MKIGIDGRSLQGNRTGVGRYVFELCRELDYILPNAQFFIYSQIPLEMPVLSDRWRLRLDPFPLSKYIKSVLWLKLRCGELCKQDNLDVFWGAGTFLPRLRHPIRKIITVYDLNYKIVPESMGTTHRWAYLLFFKKDIHVADTILTISEGTANRLCEITGRKTAAIIKPAINSIFRPMDKKEIQNCLNSYNITGPYILAVATWEPRKNLELLVKTFMSMKKEGLLPFHRLILIGRKGWKDKELHSLVMKNKEQSIISLGFLPDEHLPSLYSGADVFVFPSSYEGFGMPVLEALSCGAKVVTTDTPELREAGGPYATYITPTIEGIRNGILKSLAQTSTNNTIEIKPPSWRQGATTLSLALRGEL